jgi:hypothetical protein
LIFAGYLSGSALYRYILSYVESKVIPEIARNIGIDNMHVDVKCAGLFGAEIASLRFGKETGAPSIDSIKIDYDPIGLYNSFIKKAVISGVKIGCEITDGKIKIRGFDLDRFTSNLQTKSPPSKDLPKSLPFGRIDIRDSVIELQLKDKRLNLPADLSIIPDSRKRSRMDCRLVLYPRDHEITVLSSVNLDEKRSTLLISSKDFAFGRFSDFAAIIPEVTLSGSADITARAEFEFSPFKISSASCVITSKDLGMSYNDFKMVNLKESKKPFLLDIKNTGGKEWILTGTSISIVLPVPMTISNPEIRFDANDNSIQSSGIFSVNPASFIRVKGNDTGRANSFFIQGKYSASFTDKRVWSFRATNTRPAGYAFDRACLNLKDIDISSEFPEFEISGKGEGGTGTLQYVASISGINLFKDDLSLKTPVLTVGGIAEISNSRITGSIEIIARNAAIESDSAKIDIPELCVSGLFNRNAKTAFQLDGTLKFTDIRIENHKLQFAASGIKGTIPFEWPFNITKKMGNLSANSVFWNGLNLGALSAVTSQDGSGMFFDGEYKSTLLKEMTVGFTGKTELSVPKSLETEINFAMKQYKTGSDIDLGRFFREAKGIDFSGILELNGKISFIDKKLSGFLQGNVRQGSLKYSDKEMLIEGIEISLLMPALPAVKSNPKQRLTFSRASIGSIQLYDGKVDFQIESAESFYIEKSSFSWCNGSVNTQSIRVSPANKDLSLTLFCDRINLAMIIDQLDIATAEGNGTVNGKIPVEYKEGKIKFTDGFLYSTPGEGGTIHITGAGLLGAGTVPGVSHLTQMELTIEALKDYIYNWVRLKLVTEGEDLLLYLQFDGKPANPLPFVYKKEMGGFVRVKSAEEGSRFQGIRLDINFVIPLDKILHYRNALNLPK